MATRFVFRLVRLMELRERQLQDCQRLLAEAVRRVQQAEAHLKNVRRMQEDLNNGWRQAIRGDLNAQTVLEYESSRVALAESERIAELQVSELRKAQLECQVKVDRALARLKALQKLRERSLARFTKDANAREQAAYDDFAMMRRS